MRIARPFALVIAALLLCAAVPAGAQQADRAGLVGIGAEREMYLECRGTGAPTVVQASQPMIALLQALAPMIEPIADPADNCAG